MKTSEILAGDVLLFSFGHGIIEEAIELVTRSHYYHCAIFVDKGITFVEFQGGRKSGTSLLSDYINSGNKLEIWRDTSLTEQEREEIVNYAINHENLGYDYFAIFEELLRYECGTNINEYNEGNKRICSSFVNSCGLSVGRTWSSEHIPSPCDLILGGKLTFMGVIEK